MISTPWDTLAAAKEAGRQICDKYLGDDDRSKAHRSVEGYRWFVELARHYKRADALQLVDPNKNGGSKQPRMFGVSERHIRRVETIRKLRPKQFDRLVAIAQQGTVSLETIEHLCLHPSTDLVEVVWLVLDETNAVAPASPRRAQSSSTEAQPDR